RPPPSGGCRRQATGGVRREEFRGEGSGSGLTGIEAVGLEPGAEAGDDAVQVGQHLVVGEAEDAEAGPVEGLLARGVLGVAAVVAAAVDRDDETDSGAVEVYDVGADGLLAAERGAEAVAREA